MLKIQNSTSQKIGFRISGLEVYDTFNNKILFRDKYWGRLVKNKEINKALSLYFFNGKNQKSALYR